MPVSKLETPRTEIIWPLMVWSCPNASQTVSGFVDTEAACCADEAKGQIATIDTAKPSLTFLLRSVHPTLVCPF